MINIKICGITRLEDALLALKLGAWSIGYIFYDKSPRFIAPEIAGKMSDQLPERFLKTGVFVNSSVEEIVNNIKLSKINQIQLHGDENPEFCKNLAEKTNLPIIKAFRVKGKETLRLIELYQNKVSAVLLDTYSESEYGGTGKTLNFQLAKEAKKYDIPIILAGGINISNFKEAIQTVNPFALDISSGVEMAKGLKDKSKLEELFKLASFDF